MSKSKAFYAVWAKYFGYPSCCTQEMISYYVRNPCGAYGASLFHKRKLDGTGFIPCTKCNKLSDRQLITKISKNRLCSKPFPLQPSLDKALSEIYSNGSFSNLEKKLIKSVYG